MEPALTICTALCPTEGIIRMCLASILLVNLSTHMVDLCLLRLLITSIVVLLPSISESLRHSAEDILSVGPS